MSQEVRQSQVSKNLGEIQSLLEKAQIVRGGNSDRKTWAGSTWEQQDVPRNVPNGTDYVPPKDVARKAIDDMSPSELAELEQELAMRKSQVPNPVAAEKEILETLEGVSKAICTECTGTMFKSNNEVCMDCNGYGYTWVCDEDKAEEISKSIAEIEAKYNVGVNPHLLEKAQGKNTGGGKGESDTTPGYKDVEPVRDEDGKEDHTGEKVAKSADELISELSALLTLHKGKDEEKEDEKGDEDHEDAEEDKAMMEDMAEKSFGEELMGRSTQALMKGLQVVLQQQNEMSKAILSLAHNQVGTQEMLAEISDSQSSMVKSLSETPAPSPSNGVAGSPVAARAPKAASAGRNIVPLKKGFVTDAPVEDDGESQYSIAQLKRGASDLVVKGKLDRRVVTRMDAGVMPEEKVMKSIEAHIVENNIE